MDRPTRAQPDRDGQSGQALVEAALILPAMIFLLLCAIQLTLLQQARLATEYAAFAAARAGVVMNMNNGTSNGLRDGPMRQAAVLAVLPTFGRANSLAAIGATLVRFTVQDALLQGFNLPQVRVAILNPTRAMFAQHTHLNGREIDFDDQRPTVTPETLLSLQVRYYYELRVPFANKMIQSIWMATVVAGNATLLRQWGGKDLTAPKLNGQLNPNPDQGPDAISVTRATAAGRGFIPDGTPEGINMTGLALVGSGPQPHYLMPVSAWFSMRMQSNPFLRFAPPP